MGIFETIAISFSMAISGATLATFAIYMVVAAVLLSAHTKIYTMITPHDEFKLIREGNTSASLALSGTIIGFAIPMASVISHSIGLVDFVIWAVIASTVQLLVFYFANKVVKGLSDKIVKNELGAAIFVAALAVAVGFLNAACMTPDNSQNENIVNVLPVQE